MQMKRILVLTELNRPSEISLVFAADLAADLGVKEIVLLNVILSAQQQALDAGRQSNLSIKSELESHLNTEILKKHKAIIEKQAQENTNEYVKIIPHLEYSHPHYSVNDLMRKYKADLLVCGSKERSSFLEIVFGLQAREKTEKINYPMIVLTHEPVNTNIHDIVLAIDLEKPSQNGVDPIIEFSRLLNAHLQLLHIMVDSNESTHHALETLHEFAKSKNLENYSINLLSNENFIDGLEDFVNKIKPDMIALVNPGKGKLDKLIFGDRNKTTESERELPVFICETV